MARGNSLRLVAFGALIAAVAAAGCRKETPRALPDQGTLAYLPPGAVLYAVIDLQAVLGRNDEVKQFVLGMVPVACTEAARDTTRAVVALYGSGPDDVVAVLQGPSREAVVGCFQQGLKLPAGPVENRDGREVVTFAPDGPDDEDTFSVIAAAPGTQVVASGNVVEAALGALAGGPSLAGDPILELLSHVPPAPVVAAVRMAGPGGLGERIADLLSQESGLRQAIPVGAALSIDLTGSAGITGALVMEDAAAAGTLQAAIRSAIAQAREFVAREADDPSAMALLGQGVKVLDGISVTTSGEVVRVSLAGGALPGGLGALGALSAVSVPMYLRFVGDAKANEARLSERAYGPAGP